MTESEAFAHIISEAQSPEITDRWIANLATRLAESGDLMQGHFGQTADIPSTGGPSSLSTLLCPLFLASAGLLVPKLGVSGRPAGGLDVMAQVPGYRTKLEPVEVEAALAACRYAHFDAAGRFAPMDGRLFLYRQSSGAQAFPPLVVASLLCKKLAVGVERVGLDVRVAPHGNFGSRFEQARENASRFIRVASLLGIAAKAFVTDAERPYQPYIGRGEALLAMHAWFSGQADPWLARHVDQCLFMAAQLVDLPIAAAPSVARELFDLHLAAQGAEPAGFDRVVARLRAQTTLEVRADRDGYVGYDLDRIRSALVAAQREAPGGEAFPDPAGVILLVEPDIPVARGSPVMRIRCEGPGMISVSSALEAAVSVSRFPRNASVDVLDA